MNANEISDPISPLDSEAGNTVIPQGSLHLSSLSETSQASQHSDTSTVRYDQEPWNEYSQRVKKLCQALWPPPKNLKTRLLRSRTIDRMRANRYLSPLVPSIEAPLIERLEGGDYNRIIGITLPSTSSQPVRQLILRVPRDIDLSRVDRNDALLKYIGQRSSIPIPTVYASDFTCNNPLESPYVLQHRSPGTDLSHLWGQLDHLQRLSVAREVGRVIRTLLSIESPVTGIIEAPTDGGTEPTIAPFELKNSIGGILDETELETYAPTPSPRPRQSTLDFFTTQFMRWRAVDLDSNGGEPDNATDLWDSLFSTVQEMDLAGMFDLSTVNCLCHVDLQPRNIMARINASENSLEMTAILDWDEAVFAPKFVNCKPPYWIWGRSDDDLIDVDGYEVAGANDVPEMKEKRELKMVLEESTGEEYVRFAYGDIWRMGRGLFEIARMGLQSSETFNASRRIVKEWAEMKKNYWSRAD